MLRQPAVHRRRYPRRVVVPTPHDLDGTGSLVPDVDRSQAPRTRPPRAEVRAALVRAAYAEFNERGFHAASVEAIASRAGFTKGAVYGNFDGKFGLFLAMLDEESTSRGAFLSGLGGPGDSADEALHKVAEALVTMTTHAVMPTMVLSEVRAHAAREPELAARFAASRTDLVRALTGVLEAEAERIGMRLLVPPGDAMYAVLAIANGLALEQVGIPDPVVAADTVHRLLRALMEPA